jgi:hypothetical protein
MLAINKLRLLLGAAEARNRRLNLVGDRNHVPAVLHLTFATYLMYLNIPPSTVQNARELFCKMLYEIQVGGNDAISTRSTSPLL